MRITALALIVTLFTLSAGTALAQENIEWHTVAISIPLGSKVKVQMLDGKRVTGTLVRVSDTSVLVRRNARRPEPAQTIALNQLSNLEKDNGGEMNWAKAVGIGLGIGAGAILTIFVIALQLD